MKASCHCGNIKIVWNTTIAERVARTCSCDYCTAHQAEYISDPASLVEYTIADPARHRIQTHGHGTANFHECVNCGLVIVTSAIEGQLYCVVNAKALGLSGYTLDPIVKDNLGESIAQRLLRRKNHWSKARLLSP
jgi:hypothetical protein